MNPDQSVLALSALILARLKRQRVEGYTRLYEKLQDAFVGVDVLFAPALALLYVLGLIVYHQKTDSFEYVGP